MSLFSLIRFKPLNHYIQITLNRGREKPENTAAHKRCKYTVQGRCNLQPPFQNLFRKLEQLQGAIHINTQCSVLTLHEPSPKQCMKTSNTIKPGYLRVYTMKFKRPGLPHAGTQGWKMYFVTCKLLT